MTINVFYFRDDCQRYELDELPAPADLSRADRRMDP